MFRVTTPFLGTVVLTAALAAVVPAAHAAPVTGEPAAGPPGSRCATPATGAARTFDAEPVGAPPSGTVTRGAVTVAAAPFGASGNQAVHLTDTSASADSAVTFPGSPVPARRYALDIAPHLAVPFVLAVHGLDATGADVIAEQLTIGSIYAYGRVPTAQVSVADGTTSTPLAVIPNLTDRDAPTRVTLTAAPDALVLQVGDFVARTTAHVTPVTAVTGLEIASSGVAATGTDLYVDDVATSDAVPPQDLDQGATGTGLVDRLTAGTSAPPSAVATVTDAGAKPGDLRAEVFVGDRWRPGRLTGHGGRFTVTAALVEPNIGLHPVTVTVTDRRDGRCRSLVLNTESYAPLRTSVVSQEPGPQQPRFPDATRLQDGRLLLVYHYANAHTNANGVIRMVSSSDNGRTWTAPVTVVANQYDDRDPKIAQLRDGTVLLTTFQTDWSTSTSGTNVGTFVYRSTDGGRTFPTVARVESSASVTAEHAPAVQLPNGDVLQPVYGGGARVARSTDGGRTFPASGQTTVVADDSRYGNGEPNIVRLPSGELVMIIRTNDKSVGADRQSRLVRSFDDGKTWTAPEPTDLPASSDHLQLNRDGSVFVTFGNILQPLRPTYAALITDPAGPWRGYRQVPVYNSGVDDQANPSSVQLPNGALLSFGYNITTRQVVSWRTKESYYR